MNDHMDNRPDRNRNNPENQGPNKNHQSILAFVICLLITLVCLSFVTDKMSDKSSEITYDKFIEMVDKDQIKEPVIYAGYHSVLDEFTDPYLWMEDIPWFIRLVEYRAYEAASDIRAIEPLI